MTVEEIAGAFRRIGAKAVTLSGSKTSQINDDYSDYDIYVYSDGGIEKEKRAMLYKSLGLSSSISISFFEEGDEAFDADGNIFDIMFRDRNWLENEVESVYRRCNARIGYTTCILYNIATSNIIEDDKNWLSEIKREITSTYPERLRENIIKDNLMIIDGNFSSPFMRQLELAAIREDAVSMNHRLSAILASYFDVLFAYNRVYHPGEKKLLRYAKLLLSQTPESFEDDVINTIRLIGQDGFIESAKLMMKHLHALVD